MSFLPQDICRLNWEYSKAGAPVAKKWTHLKGLIHSHVWQLILAVDCQLEMLAVTVNQKICMWLLGLSHKIVTGLQTLELQENKIEVHDIWKYLLKVHTIF